MRLSSKILDDTLQPVTIIDGDPLSTVKSLRSVVHTSLAEQNEKVEATVFLNWLSLGGRSLILSRAVPKVWSIADFNSSYVVDGPTRVPNVADICRPAKILRKVDPLTFGIMQCKGVLKSLNANDEPEYRLLFNNPQTLSEPEFSRTEYLRTALESSCESYSLDDRFSLTQKLAKAVMFIHSMGFVHKNIRPEIILTFRGPESRHIQAFLTGFERFRLAEGKTSYQGDDEWQKNIYRHPTRQGLKPESNYVMQHDIYSLGVCLLELGLGISFVRYEKDYDNPLPDPQIQSAAGRIRI